MACTGSRTGKSNKALECTLGSGGIFGFVTLRGLLDGALQGNGGINFTQFRLLLISAEDTSSACLLSELADKLHIQPNVLSQASNALEGKGFIVRVPSHDDARAKSIEVTDAGRAQIELLNKALAKSLYETFNPENDPLYNKILETSIRGAAEIETSLTKRFVSKHQASAALITYSIVLERISDALAKEVDASFNECRMLQRLAEVGQPMRAVDLSMQLGLPPTTITRAATRLEKRGWLQRMASSANQQAIFLEATRTGKRKESAIFETLDRVADEVLWSRLDEGQSDAVSRVGEILLEKMKAQDGIRRYAVIGELTPLMRK